MQRLLYVSYKARVVTHPGGINNNCGPFFQFFFFSQC